MRRLQSYVNKYGPELGPKFYHALQSQAAHASVSARLRRKIDVLSGRAPRVEPSPHPRTATRCPFSPNVCRKTSRNWSPSSPDRRTWLSFLWTNWVPRLRTAAGPFRARRMRRPSDRRK